MSLLAATLGAGCGPAGHRPTPPLIPPLEATVDAGPPEPLSIGAAAPALNVAHWISPGDPPVEPFETFEPGRIYVLEFWAPWCQFCRRAIPQINAAAGEFGSHDVTFVGMTHEDEADVRLFLDTLPESDRPRYCLAADPDGSVHRDYLEAIAETGIPTVFIVGRDGRVEWIGHPDALVQILGDVVKGSFDRAAFAAEFTAERRLAARVEDIGFTLAAGRTAAAITAAGALVAEADGDAAALNEVAWKLVKLATDCDAPPAILDAAEDAARRSLALSPDDGNTLDTLAHVQERRGDLDGAIASQRRAVEHAGGFETQFRSFLADLEARKAEREAAVPQADTAGEKAGPEPAAR